MPSRSTKQHRFMEAAAHNPAFAKRNKIPQSVAAEFVSADMRTGKKFDTKAKKTRGKRKK